ncbi:MAG: hypothetical protein ACE365_06245 [Gammaproteobacteria bacterium]
MIKIPKFDELKKMGEGLAENAKSGALFNKIKSSVDGFATGGAHVHEDFTPSGDAMRDHIALCQKQMNDLLEIQKIQANLINNLAGEIKKLAQQYNESHPQSAKEEPTEKPQSDPSQSDSEQ